MRTWLNLTYQTEPDWHGQPSPVVQTLRNLGLSVLEIARGHHTPTSHIAALQALTLERAKVHRPDVLFIEGATVAVPPPLVTPTLIQKLRPFCGKIVLWWGEVRERPFPAMKTLAPWVDLMLLINSSQHNVYRQAGFKNVGEFHMTLSETSRPPVPAHALPYDVIFCGRHYGSTFPLSRERAILLTSFAKHFGKRFAVLGENWEPFRFPNYLGSTHSKRDVLRHMHKARVVLGINQYDYTHYYPERTWQALASGRAYLVRHIPGMERDFTPGVHLQTFTTKEDAIEKAEDLLTTGLAESIGQIGRELFLSRYTLEHLLQELVRSLSNRPTPQRTLYSHPRP